MKLPYKVTRTLKRYEGKNGKQVMIRIRSSLFKDIEIPVYDFMDGKKIRISVKPEHWSKGTIIGGKYYKPIRDLNLHMANIEHFVKDAIYTLFQQKIIPTRENVLECTYIFFEPFNTKYLSEKDGFLTFNLSGGGSGLDDDALNSPFMKELREVKGNEDLLKREYILDFWDEFITKYAPDEYGVIQPSIFRYIERTGDNCRARDFNSLWLERYFTFIIKKGYQKKIKNGERQCFYEVSTVEKYLKIMRGFGKWLFEEKEVINTEDYKRFKLRNSKSKKSSLLKISSNPFKNTHALLKKEFDDLFFFKFDNQNDALIRDLFILQTWFGGLRKSDFFNLTKDNISILDDEVQVQFEQQKTDTKVVNMANKHYVTPIILKYGNKLPDFPSSNKFNARLKVVFKIAGLDRKLPFRFELSNEDKPRTEYFEMHKKVSNRWARNCAVSILVEMGYNDHYIKKFTGHTDVKMLRYYRDVHKLQVKEMLNEVIPIRKQ